MISRNDIIGQTNLLNQIDTLIEKNLFPRFSIIIGNKNSGKKLIANYISDKLGATFVPCDIKADSVRDVINEAYTQTSLMCYMWADSDSMSITSKNAILKVTEEPPNSAYFIITLNDINNMIPTIISRGTQFFINPYTNKDIKDYAKLREYEIDNFEDIILNICSNPGELDTLFTYNVREFINFTSTVLDNIGIASYANALKLSNKFSLKKDDVQNYDIKLFIRCISSICLDRLKKTNDCRYAQACLLCTECLSEFRVSSISKIAVLDKWLINLKDIFSEEGDNK